MDYTTCDNVVTEDTKKRSWGEAFANAKTLAVKPPVCNSERDRGNTDKASETVAKPKASETVSANAEAATLICCGAITDVKAKLRSPKSTASWRTIFQNVDHVELKLQKESGRYLLSLVNLSDFAVINSKLTLALEDLQDVATLQIEAYANTLGLCDALLAQSGARHVPVATINLQIDADLNKILTLLSRNTSVFSIELNIFCHRVEADVVGRTLCNHEIFLQPPIESTVLSLYENPQELKFSDIVGEDTSVCDGQTIDDGNRDGHKDKWEMILDTLPQHHAQFQTTQSPKIITSLMQHQIDGVDFIHRRETLELPDRLRFWKKVDEDGESLSYRHLVTGATTQIRPMEPNGGIVADEMGVGKTLTMLASIANSWNRARAFAQGQVVEHGTPLLRTRATLIVAPSLLILDTWIEEVKRRTVPDSLKFSVYHTHSRARHAHQLRDHDLVLTTYGTIAVEYRKKRDVLSRLHWFRIVLDEGHTIRACNTKQFEAVMSLQALHHWCLTGTPISNTVDDLMAPFRFCRVPLLEDRQWFLDHISKPTKRSFQQGCRVLQQALAPLCLRRTKALLHLPEPEISKCVVQFSTAEASQYAEIFESCRQKIESAVSGRDKDATRHTLLRTILALRIFCNQGTYVKQRLPSSNEPLDQDEQYTLLDEEGQAHCHQCSAPVMVIGQLEDPTSGVLGKCKHVLCNLCYAMVSTSRRHRSKYYCPLCHTSVKTTRTTTKPNCGQGDANLLDTYCRSGQSAKLDALVQKLETSTSNNKSIVFSVWKKTLLLTSQLLSDKRIKHVIVHGQTPHSERQQALDRFSNDENTTILLITLGTGAFGLSLTAATRIHLLEPQWNPSMEKQAIGRAVRIGQEKTTKVIRYFVEGSIEEQVRGYQQRKLQLVSGGFGDTISQAVETEVSMLTASFFHDAKEAGQRR